MSCVFICNDNWHAKNNFKKYILGCRGKNQTRDKKKTKTKQNKVKKQKTKTNQFLEDELLQNHLQLSIHAL